MQIGALRIIAIVLAVLVALVVFAWLALRGPDIPYATLEAKYTGRSSRFVDRWAELQRAPGHRAILMSINLASGHATPELLGRITVPTLVINGESDVLIEPASARKFAAAIPGAKLIIYPQVGHLPQIEIPQRSAADVAEFLQSPH
jgi:pimeloyl-ACP methyl ester carboxylesterase